MIDQPSKTLQTERTDLTHTIIKIATKTDFELKIKKIGLIWKRKMLWKGPRSEYQIWGEIRDKFE